MFLPSQYPYHAMFPRRDIQGSFAKFMDSPYSGSELHGGAVTVFFFPEVPPLTSEALLTTFHPLSKNVLQTIDHFKFLTSELPLHDWKIPEVAWGEIRTVWRLF